ncbi:MAG: M24 family metallopeptidase [Gaiellaceae bacterium]
MDVRLPRSGAQRAGGCRRDAHRRRGREPDGDQEHGGARAPARELQVGQPRAHAAAALHAPGRVGNGSREPRLERGNLRDARRHRPDLPRAEPLVLRCRRRLSRPDRPQEHGLWENWRHHVGHAIGLRYHEGPFLDRGDETEIRPGMVFTVEPGLYAPGVGGFRHSDTIAVTDDGVEWLTYYPRDLESLTLPV